MTQYHARIAVNLEALTSTFQRTLQRTLDLVSFGLLTARRARKEQQLELPRVFFHIFPSRNTALDFKSAKTEFPGWLLGVGLQQCIDATNSLVDEVHRILIHWSLAARSPITGKDWNEAQREIAEFHLLGLPQKTQLLKKSYAFQKPQLAGSVFTLNAARNCLVHRRGLVSPADVSKKGILKVKWLKPQIIVEGRRRERVISRRSMVKGGETIKVRLTEFSRTFAVGDHLLFSAQEFAEMCWTLFNYGQQVRSTLAQIGKSKGYLH